uniref:spermine synthase-like n=1 Tax=Styela clava TaxID=7725 RepID=UPI001939E33A|nr:spermine synthase-like [Styela clava]
MDSWLLEFRINVKMSGKREEFINEISKLIKTMDINCKLVFQSRQKITALYANSNRLKVLLQEADEGLFTLDIHTTNIDNPEFKALVNKVDEDIRKLEFAEIPKTPRYDSLPPLKRGREFSCYDVCEGFIVEKDFDKVVFDEVTSKQHIRILHSVAFGNCLYCDNDTNIGETDYEAFSYALSGFGRVEYTNKTVLILGGGDGCIVRRIKDLGASMITAVDYDQRMIDVTKLYFRPICGDVLDSMTGKNYRIIIEDAEEYLKRAVKNRLKVDVIINDITSIPVSLKNEGNKWIFLRQLLNLSMEVLKENGIYICHGNAARHPQYQKLFENALNKLKYSVTFSKEIAYIPSYQENWIIYLIWKNSKKQGCTHK